MAGYNELKGLRVKYLLADPANPEDGQVWYNSTTGNLRVQGIGVAAWSSATPMISAKKAAMPGGIQTAAFTAGGNDGSTNVNSTFEYNGSGFSSGGNINTTRRGGSGGGTLTAGIICGGFTTAVTNATEEYDGTSWTSGNNMNTSRSGQAGFGTQTANVISGGQPGVGTATEEYDGTNWTTVNANPTDGSERAGDGILTAGITFGGHTPAPTKISSSELYDGTNWTSAPSLNTARERLSGFGTQLNAYAFGGDSATTTVTFTENYNGTSWTETSDMATARKENQSGQTGSPTAGIAMGGNTAPGSVISATEEYNFGTTTITPAAWSSGGAFPTASSQVAGAGPRDAALGIGGYPEGSIPTGKSYEYNGVAWSTEATLNPSTGTAGVNAAAGTQTACINTQNTAGGAPFSYTAAGEYDGTSWTNANTRPANNYSNAGAGTLTAGLFFGGTSSPTGTTNATVSYDGTNWTVESPLNTGRSELAGSGVQTAALGSGGYSNPPATFYASTEEYNGTSWTTVNSLNTETRNGKSSGFQTDAIIMGGRNPGPVNTTNSFRYDGTVWSTAPSLATARNDFGNGATSPVGAAWGSAGYYPGSTPNRTNTTEHFNVETVAVNPANNLSVS